MSGRPNYYDDGREAPSGRPPYHQDSEDYPLPLDYDNDDLFDSWDNLQ